MKLIPVTQDEVKRHKALSLLWSAVGEGVDLHSVTGFVIGGEVVDLSERPVPHNSGLYQFEYEYEYLEVWRPIWLTCQVELEKGEEATFSEGLLDSPSIPPSAILFHAYWGGLDVIDLLDSAVVEAIESEALSEASKI